MDVGVKDGKVVGVRGRATDRGTSSLRRSCALEAHLAHQLITEDWVRRVCTGKQSSSEQIMARLTRR